MGSMLLSGNCDLVLCVGDDGHVAVESAYHHHGGCPHDAEDCVHQNADQPADKVDVHTDGGCDDIPLDIASLVAKTQQAHRHLANGPLPTMSPFGDTAASLRSTAYWQQHSPCEAMPRLAQSLLVKQTIVLRV